MEEYYLRIDNILWYFSQ